MGNFDDVKEMYDNMAALFRDMGFDVKYTPPAVDDDGVEKCGITIKSDGADGIKNCSVEFASSGDTENGLERKEVRVNCHESRGETPRSVEDETEDGVSGRTVTCSDGDVLCSEYGDGWYFIATKGYLRYRCVVTGFSMPDLSVRYNSKTNTLKVEGKSTLWNVRDVEYTYHYKLDNLFKLQNFTKVLKDGILTVTADAIPVGEEEDEVLL